MESLKALERERGMIDDEEPLIVVKTETWSERELSEVDNVGRVWWRRMSHMM